MDDKETLRRLVYATFKGNGDYEIIQLATGEEAIQQARAQKPHLIIMDLMMPGKFDGLEATRAIKNDAETKNIPVVFLTAKGQQADIQKGYDAGANDYIVKPFSPTELIEKVEKLIS